MKNKQTYIGAGIIVLFLIGAVYIVLQGRPVVQLREELEAQSEEHDSVVSEVIEFFEDEDEGMDIDDAEEIDTAAADANVTTNAAPTTNPTPTAPAEPTTPVSSGPLTFSMTTVATHNTRNDCWAAVNGSVYDLTTWVSRHPGGAQAIISLCGTDGTSAFNARHGRSNSAKNALALLKIGVLQ